MLRKKRMWFLWTMLTVLLLVFVQIDATADYDGDAKTDIALHRPDSTWTTVPVLFANGDGIWTATNKSEPGWANQPDVIAVPGDYNQDGRSDIALYRPNSTWNTVPVLFANGDGTWTGTNKSAPSWASQPGVIAIPGDYNSDGRRDIASIALARHGLRRLCSLPMATALGVDVVTGAEVRGLSVEDGRVTAVELGSERATQPLLTGFDPRSVNGEAPVEIGRDARDVPLFAVRLGATDSTEVVAMRGRCTIAISAARCSPGACSNAASVNWPTYRSFASVT